MYIYIPIELLKILYNFQGYFSKTKNVKILIKKVYEQRKPLEKLKIKKIDKIFNFWKEF